MLKIKANGKEKEIENRTTLSKYIKDLGLSPELIVCELNYEIPKKEDWENLCLNDGDNLEIVKFIGGG